MVRRKRLPRIRPEKSNETVWLSNLPEFSQMLNVTQSEIIERVTDISFDSIVNGSSLTGAPGQPTDLKDFDASSGKDWQKVVTPTEGVIGNNDKSARSVEDGISYRNGGVPIKKLKSSEGGFHSVALTYQGMDKIVAQVIREVQASNG